MNDDKIVIVVSGPSGAGKTTLINMVLDRYENQVGCSTSYTTRSMRHGEVNGKDYFFVSVDDFQKKIQNNEFIEYVKCFGNFYGTHKGAVTNVLKKKRICILDLEWDGAFSVLDGDALSNIISIGILILPPSSRVQKKRINTRGSENEQSLNKRLNDTFKHSHVAKYENVIINDNLDTAFLEIEGIIKPFLGEGL